MTCSRCGAWLEDDDDGEFVMFGPVVAGEPAAHCPYCDDGVE